MLLNQLAPRRVAPGENRPNSRLNSVREAKKHVSLVGIVTIAMF
jgi:hypothetical protein